MKRVLQPPHAGYTDEEWQERATLLGVSWRDLKEQTLMADAIMEKFLEDEKIEAALLERGLRVDWGDIGGRFIPGRVYILDADDVVVADGSSLQEAYEHVY